MQNANATRKLGTYSMSGMHPKILDGVGRGGISPAKRAHSHALGIFSIVPGLLWARLGMGSRGSLLRVAPSLALIAVGSFILCAGTVLTIKQMGQGAQGGPTPAMKCFNASGA